MATRPKEFSLAGWRLALADGGISQVNVLRRAGLPDDFIAGDEPRATSDEFFRLWRAIEDEVNDPRMPLMVVSNLRAEAFDPAIFAALCSPDLQTAMRRLRDHKKLVGPMRLLVDVDDRVTRIEFQAPGKTDVPTSFMVTELAFAVMLARLGTRAEVRPLALTCACEVPEPRTDYVNALGTPFTRGDEYSVTFANADATRPFLTANAPMWRFFEGELKRRLVALEADASTTERVRAALLELLPAGLSGADDVAEKLGRSRRTLQRRLKEEGESFQSLLAQTREELARHYLSRTRMPAAEISFLLGFEDPNSFFRAFHSWTGETPERVRAGAQTH